MAKFSACGGHTNGNTSKPLIWSLLLKKSPPVRAAKICGTLFLRYVQNLKKNTDLFHYLLVLCARRPDRVQFLAKLEDNYCTTFISKGCGKPETYKKYTSERGQNYVDQASWRFRAVPISVLGSC
jgi:hypothetical protein